MDVEWNNTKKGMDGWTGTSWRGITRNTHTGWDGEEGTVPREAMMDGVATHSTPYDQSYNHKRLSNRNTSTRWQRGTPINHMDMAAVWWKLASVSIIIAIGSATKNVEEVMKALPMRSHTPACCAFEWLS